MQVIIIFETSSIKGNGYGSFFVVTFSFIKFTQILSFPFFLGATTIDDNQVAFFKGCVNHVFISLFLKISTI
jgi:hypothetical protein